MNHRFPPVIEDENGRTTGELRGSDGDSVMKRK
jgi:hypothetical protein